jgi:hypothetical protein
VRAPVNPPLKAGPDLTGPRPPARRNTKPPRFGPYLLGELGPDGAVARVICRGMSWQRACQALEALPEGFVVRIDAAWCAPASYGAP